MDEHLTHSYFGGIKMNRSRLSIASISLALTLTLSMGSPALADGDGNATGCLSPAELRAADAMSALMDGIEVLECELVGESIAIGQDVMPVPALGEAVMTSVTTAYPEPSYYVLLATRSDGFLYIEGTSRTVLAETANSPYLLDPAEPTNTSSAVDRCARNAGGVNGIWPSRTPDVVAPADYLMNLNSDRPASVTTTNWQNAIANAEYIWEGGVTSCGYSRSFDKNIAVDIGNTTSRSNVTSSGCALGNGVNVFDFGSLPTGVLGRACTYYGANIPVPGVPGAELRRIIESDIKMNMDGSLWTMVPADSSCDGEYDFLGVVAHEFGHFVGFMDMDGLGAGDIVMGGSMATCDGSKRLLGAGDYGILVENYTNSW